VFSPVNNWVAEERVGGVGDTSVSLLLQFILTSAYESTVRSRRWWSFQRCLSFGGVEVA
jgi:hypothetical protein